MTATTNTDWLRERLLRDLSPVGTVGQAAAQAKVGRFFGPDGVFPVILRHAQARMLVGTFRYEQAGADGRSHDERARHGQATTYVERMRAKLDAYAATGNQEFLVDLLNYVGLEWADPYHPRAHFASTERMDHEVR